MIHDDSHHGPVTAKALLVALSVLVLTQVGVTIFYLVILYGLAGNHLNWTLMFLNGLYGLEYALPTSAAAFVIAFLVFGAIQAVRWRRRTKII